MKTIYVYVLNTLADWEIGYVTAELNSKRFFKTDAPLTRIQTVSHSKQPIQTMGGIEIIPDCLVEEIDLNKNNVLLLPGADTWNEPEHISILDVARKLLIAGGVVGAICGATVAIANIGLLNERAHTSNGLEFLKLFSSSYQGDNLYLDQSSVSNNNLITSGSTGALMWTKQIIETLQVFEKNTLEAWYNYFNTGNTSDFFKLMQTLPPNNKNLTS